MSRIVGLHRPDGVERQKDDYYATCPSAIPPLLKLLDWQGGGKTIWENSCGQGHLSEMLKIYGHTVISSDLIDRGYGVTGIDFLSKSVLHDLPYDAIIMNPPYKLATQFITKSFAHAPIVCAFLRLSFLESKKRKQFFKSHPPKYVAVFSNRVASVKDGDFKIKKGTVAYAWFVWQEGHIGDTIVKWI